MTESSSDAVSSTLTYTTLWAQQTPPADCCCVCYLKKRNPETNKLEWGTFSTNESIIVESRPSGVHRSTQKWSYCRPCWDDMCQIREGTFNLLAHLAKEKAASEPEAADDTTDELEPDPDEGLYLMD